MLARHAANPAVWTARARRDPTGSCVRDRVRLGPECHSVAFAQVRGHVTGPASSGLLTAGSVIADLTRADAGRALLAMLRTVAGQRMRRLGRGPVRGPSHRCNQCNQGNGWHGSVLSVQVVIAMHEAVLLIILRSWVRAPPATTTTTAQAARLVRLVRGWAFPGLPELDVDAPKPVPVNAHCPLYCGG